ncbi:disease resistance protein RPM1 [Brachypodium distachyon]|uniref:disease resistance protein RPM1 n=1 Tax=Brachypodium distachyon TaxID=15368 RepID=UPI0001C70837|nr:disease resistance protein RPM1 [Brachypodium distachyon]|eukprot:XP_003575853.1 disease resistance protein RPM1 [Brachypodium distachyon]
MAELAGGAVRSLLSVIRDEAQLLGGVGGDVQFIKEEMESMNSFLMHLARKTPRSGEHDEQVSTWMKQVRDLAHDCSNSIDIYLRRRDPAVYRARGVLLGYVWWVPWFVKKTLAQHLAANQLRDLKARARDVGERRLRYGVEVPAKAADSEKLLMSPTEAFQAAAGVIAEGEHDLEEDYYRATNDDPRRELAFSKPRFGLKCTETLMNWLERQHEDGRFQAIAIAAPDEEDGNDLIDEALSHDSVTEKFDHAFTLEDQFCPKEPRDFLGDMLEALEDGESAEESGEEEVHDSISMVEEEIDEKISKIEEKIEEHLEKAGNKGYRVEPIGVLCGILRVLLQDAAILADEDQTQEKTILEDTAEKMKKYVESADEKDACTIGVQEHHPEFVAILQELLPKQATAPAKAATDKPGEDHIVKNIRDITLKIQVQIQPELLPITSLLQQDKSDKESPLSPGEDEEYCRERIEQVLKRMKEHLLIQETAGRVRKHLQGTRTLIILKNAYGYKWEETTKALQDLGCTSMAVVVTTKYMQSANEFCYGTEPIVYSSIEHYHDTALQLTNRRVNDDDKYSAKIFHEILEKCRLDVFCTKMFIHTLFANPMRRREELDKLSNSLVFGGSVETNGYKMIKFSYNDLPRDYKTCLLYLAIFHKNEKIIRTRLIGRWVAEGLITRQDWSSSVGQAERCFDVLADLWLVCPSDVDAGGKVKSITLHPLVYSFITKMAKKEHILDTRLSRHLARHFSILSNIRLRPSDSIVDFLKQPSNASSQLKLVKVLDLEGCASLRDNQRWLRNVCTLLILLKYLSLRNTDVTQLPKEINRLQQLEVLDIRRTPMNASAIKHLMLLKLKRLLAGQSVYSDDMAGQSACFDDTGGGDASILSTVMMPHKVRKMTDLEVLSRVQASKHHATELREVGQLWQLKVFGVVIYDWKAQLDNLLQGISDLNECLVSLSIEIKPLPPSEAVATPPDADAISAHCKNPPKLLESLSISGVTMYGRLLPFFARGCRKLAKVTLHNTVLDQDDMESLADLPNLRGLKLRDVKLHSESKLIIQTNGFQNLKYLLVEGGGITDIDFETGEAPKLEKIVWLIDQMESLSGINNLPKLKEMVFNDGIRLPDQVKEAIEAHPNFIDNNGIWW